MVLSEPYDSTLLSKAYVILRLLCQASIEIIRATTKYQTAKYPSH